MEKDSYKKEGLLYNAIKNLKPSHAYVFYGRNEENLDEAALYFAKGLLCSEATRPCDTCISCDKIDKNNHPDVLHIRKDGLSVKINQVRKIRGESYFDSSEGAFKVFIIHDASTMNDAAQNAFLKTLEEPTGNSVFILLCKNTNALLPTVLSRCSVISFEKGETYYSLSEEEKKWLILNTEKLVSVRNSSVTSFARKFPKEKEKVNEYVTYLLNFFSDALFYKGASACVNDEGYYKEALENICRVMNISRIKRTIEEINSVLINLNYNLNVNIAVSALLIFLQEDTCKR